MHFLNIIPHFLPLHKDFGLPLGSLFGIIFLLHLLPFQKVTFPTILYCSLFSPGVGAPGEGGSWGVGAETTYLYIFIPLVREGLTGVLSDLQGRVCVEEPTVWICPTKGSSTLEEKFSLEVKCVGTAFEFTSF